MKSVKIIFILIFMYLMNGNLIAQSSHDTHQTSDSEKTSETVHGEEDSQHSKDDGEHHSLHLDGSTVNLFWIIPFIGILLSIAVLPLIAPHFWHQHYGKVSLFWGSLFIILFGAYYGTSMAAFYLAEVYLGEFIPFIVLLLTLFTVAGGVQLTGTLRGSPIVNTLLLLIGTVLASWMGTTGAAMLLIRPIIRANAWRNKKVHIIVFFIFLVANIGGSLTPLGDPPLFLGFLKGVSFFWTTTHMLMPMIFVSVILLVLFFFLDSYFYRKEGTPPDDGVREPLGMKGKANLLLLPLVVGAVLISGIWHPDATNPDDWAIYAWGTCLMTKGVFAQVGLLLIITIVSWKITPASVRHGNGFTWEPILEVGKLFATIFITMVPPIAILRAGSDGALKFIIDMVKNPTTGEYVNSMFFWATGILSSFLDNAPTYVVFFNTAGGDANILMNTFPGTLLAISAGAVFMGANTYIGNAPNFMVKSIAEENKIDMPSFFGYMVWSVAILVPIFIITTFIFF
ncbi:MAG: sodium:proton antiporter [Candidatus Marinimicrobia bacterium]|jgi:Na+/H+ antiporter NhaD/arsenite permease-like protein|nr:sodium:proton antiporter [Candidatus Neomarinimicrobiota bacterium]MBT3682674.1 sodium:proton antiporter [Candidatus Neomarinimicrobiota bacterium]MBT3759671.1 sodium:proton antiporter [Candidatus Neomarinimicrobiota bacterium]MBT3894457.1 sodium:proton antiporter [Candidatus Neomarinimicrobiota bacterium]MBT4172500.1 sodium:proton antiporter [Candidatus Neomarinimicrobiota bacterium]